MFSSITWASLPLAPWAPMGTILNPDLNILWRDGGLKELHISNLLPHLESPLKGLLDLGKTNLAG